MKRFICFITAILCVVFTYADIPANTNKFVNDFANVMDNSTIQTLEKRLQAYSDTTTNQICIVTVNSLDDKTPAEYAQELGQKWGVGQKDKNNGIVILVKPKQLTSKGEVFIATGYGVEGALPDALCKRIIERKMIPLFKLNDYNGAINSAVNEIVLILDNDPESMANKKEEVPWKTLIIIAVVFLIFLIWAIADEDSLPGIIMASISSDLSDSSSSSSFGGGSFGGGGAGGSW